MSQHTSPHPVYPNKMVLGSSPEVSLRWGHTPTRTGYWLSGPECVIILLGASRSSSESASDSITARDPIAPRNWTRHWPLIQGFLVSFVERIHPAWSCTHADFVQKKRGHKLTVIPHLSSSAMFGFALPLTYQNKVESTSTRISFDSDPRHGARFDLHMFQSSTVITTLCLNITNETCSPSLLHMSLQDCS